MKRKNEFIKNCISSCGCKSYLELGIDKGECFENIKCDRKIGVDIEDPKVDNVIVTTTDDFFENNNETFDCIFIDADHCADAVLKDFKNSFEALNDGGIIIMHDIFPHWRFIYPFDHPIQKISKKSAGTAFVTWATLIDCNPFAQFYTKVFSMFHDDDDQVVDVLGLFYKGSHKLFIPNDVLICEWREYVENVERYVRGRMISDEDFFNIANK